MRNWHIHVIGSVVSVIMLACFGILMYGIVTDTFWDYNKICGKCNCTEQQ